MFRFFVASMIVCGAAAMGAATAQADTYYQNCSEAREAGVTPIMQGQDGYDDHLDRDGDGVACE
jgi:hypothetical protein